MTPMVCVNGSSGAWNFCIKKLPSADGTDGSEGMMETATGVS